MNNLYKAVLCLGTNIGDRKLNLQKAISYINNLYDTKVIRKSFIYETLPFGIEEEQPNFYNCCIEIETTLIPEILMGACLGIESAMGRNRPYHYAPRTIDIDIIACENYNSDKDYLTVPHKLYKERAFVLIPLMDLYPDMDLYGDKFDISNLSNINDVVRKENI